MKEKRNNEQVKAQNSKFTNRTSRHTTKVCKRAVYLPMFPLKRLNLNFKKLKLNR